MTGKNFSGTYTTGFTLTDPSYNPVTVTGTIDVAAGQALDGAGSIAWTITNQGIIASTDTAATGAGISLTAGGTVSNAAGALISGSTGVYASGVAATVVNYGTVGVAPGFGNAVFLKNGGFVSNASGGTLIGSGVGIEANGVTTVFNQGAIDAPAALVGVALHSSGLLSNAATGIITGTQFGAYFTSGSGTIVNAGTIGMTGTPASASDSPRVSPGCWLTNLARRSSARWTAATRSAPPPAARWNWRRVPRPGR